MKAYRAVLSARFRTLLQYRAAALAGVGTQFFWGFIRIMIFEAFYRSTTTAQPMTFSEIVTYVWLGQAFLGLLLWGADLDVRNQVRSGTVAYEMLRPLDLYTFWFSRAMALRTAPTLLRSVPLVTIAGLFFGLSPPASWASAGAWLLATLGALLLSCAMANLLTITLLWTLSGEGITHLMTAAVWVFSGILVPLPLFPDWAQAILNVLPFRGLIDIPFRLYMGHIPPGDLLPLLAHQAIWILAIIFLGRILLSRGTRRLVVQGG